MPLLLADIDWNALLQKPDVLPLLVCMGTACLLGLTGIIAVQWRKAQQTISEARLKERMIERGYTASEITAVLSVGVRRGKKRMAEDIPECCEPIAKGQCHGS